MDQQPHDVIPQVNMPQQSAEVLPNSPEHMVSVTNEAQAATGVEQGRPAGGVVVGLPPNMVGTIDPVVGVPSTVPMTDPGALTTTGMPGIADDTDLIEKEWVEKAKAIVAQTKHDPYVQNTELTKMKADYMKKRYNKDLRLT